MELHEDDGEDSGEHDGEDEEDGDEGSEEDVETKLVSMSVSKSLIRDWRDLRSNSRDSITAFLSSSSTLSREQCRLGQKFPPESKFRIPSRSMSNCTELNMLITELNNGERTRLSGGISFCRRRPAHRPNVEATYRLLGILLNFEQCEDLAGKSSRAETLWISSGNVLNISLLAKSVGRVPQTFLVRIYQFF